MEYGRWLFAQECVFLSGAVSYSGIPDSDLPEVAFAGRSNVGKSTLVNRVTNRKSLARTSSTPGRTRQINFFQLRDKMILADLPGYGYARASKAEVRNWTRLIYSYLRGRPNLRRVCLLIDARREIGKADEQVMQSLDLAAVSYQVILTKCDKVKPGTLQDVATRVSEIISRRPAAHPRVLCTSALRSEGVQELRADLARIVPTSQENNQLAGDNRDRSTGTQPDTSP